MGQGGVFPAAFAEPGQTQKGAALAVQGLVKRYGSITAVDSISFTVR
ncbi:MAG: hypothetical protein AB1652_09415 [Bacillota bacterium]